MVRLIVQNYSCNYRFNRGTRKACATYSRYGDSGKAGFDISKRVLKLREELENGKTSI